MCMRYTFDIHHCHTPMHDPSRLTWLSHICLAAGYQLSVFSISVSVFARLFTNIFKGVGTGRRPCKHAVASKATEWSGGTCTSTTFVDF